MIISLTGFMGCGKSSVGRRLSELLCCSFIDLDDVIAEREGRSIPEIFATEGEAAFRQMELEALKAVLNSESERHTNNDIVLALGGGAVTTEACALMVRDKTLCVYLRASVDTLVEHLAGEAAGRPMLANADLRTRIETLMQQRASTYEKTAHVTVDTDGKTIEAIASDIISITAKLS